MDCPFTFFDRPFSMFLFTDDHDANAFEFDKYKDVSIIPKTCSGHVQPWYDNGGAIDFVVYINIRDQDIKGILSTVVHESVHVKQRLLDHYGEDKPGNEEEAYLIETIFRVLWQGCNNMIDNYKKQADELRDNLPEKVDLREKLPPVPKEPSIDPSGVVDAGTTAFEYAQHSDGTYQYTYYNERDIDDGDEV